MNIEECFEKAKNYGDRFAYDGCHKIYVIKNDEEAKEAAEMGYYIFPIEMIEKTFEDSCSLKFISSFDLEHTFITQFQFSEDEDEEVED